MNFCILKIFNTETKDCLYKLYRFNHHEWAINSGIKAFKESQKYISFLGYSGSSYSVNKNFETSNITTGPSLDKLKNLHEDLKVEIITFEDFKKEFVGEA